MLLPKDEAIVAAIVEAAQQLFQKYGLKKTTMEDIAGKAGKGKSTLYYYFKCKDEILVEVVNREIEQVLQNTHAAVAQQSTTRDKLIAFFKSRLEALRVKANLYQVMRGEMAENYHVVQTLRHKYTCLEAKFLRDILHTGVVEGELRPMEAPELELLATVFIASFHGLELALFFEGSAECQFRNLDTRVPFLINALMDGLAAK